MRASRLVAELVPQRFGHRAQLFPVVLPKVEGVGHAAKLLFRRPGVSRRSLRARVASELHDTPQVPGVVQRGGAAARQTNSLNTQPLKTV